MSLPVWGDAMRGDESKNYHYSLDVARIGRDRYCLTIGEIDADGVMRIVAYDSWAGTAQRKKKQECRFTNNPDEIIGCILDYHHAKGFHATKVYVDATSDPYFCEALTKKLLPTEPIQWSEAKKERLISHLESSFRARRLKIPNSPTMKQELYAYAFDVERMKDRQERRLYLASDMDDHVASLAMLSQSITLKNRKGYSKLIWK
jgi:hypothetical protein